MYKNSSRTITTYQGTYLSVYFHKNFVRVLLMLLCVCIIFVFVAVRRCSTCCMYNVGSRKMFFVVVVIVVVGGDGSIEMNQYILCHQSTIQTI